MNDHDLLIKLDQKLTDMGSAIKTDSAANTKAHDAILEKIDEQRTCIFNQSRNCVSTKLFYWLLGFIILGLIGISGVTADNNTKINNLETKVEMIYDVPDDIPGDE